MWFHIDINITKEMKCRFVSPWNSIMLSIHLEAWLLIYVVMQATKSPDLIIFL